MTTIGPLQTQVYVDPVLAKISIAYTNPSYIADNIFPELQVDKRTGVYYVYDKQKFRITNDLRAPNTRSQEVEYGLTKATYGPLIEHSLAQGIPWEVRTEAVAPLNPDIDATENVTEKIKLNKENDAFLQCSNTSVVTQNVTLSGAQQWSDYTNSDPIADVALAVDTVKTAIMKPASQMTLVLGYQVFSKLRNHPQILERIKYSQLGIVTADLLAAVFNVKSVLIAEAEVNTANVNQTDVMSFLWGKNAWVFFTNDAPAVRSISFGYTLQMGATQVTRWTEQWTETDYVKVKRYYQQLVVAAVAGYAILSAVA
jgi:hypothetical protein